jgi:hypothetical protein
MASQFQLNAVIASENPSYHTDTHVSFHSGFGALTEQYIPDSRQFSIQLPSSASDMILIMIHPFFQELTPLKNETTSSTWNQKNELSMLDELFYCYIFQPYTSDKNFQTFSAKLGQEVVWYKWIMKNDSAAFFNSLKMEAKPEVLRELVTNKSLSYIQNLGMNVLEVGKILDKKSGKIFFSTTADMKAGDCYMVIIPHLPFTPDSIKARTILYAREGIETKIYTDEVKMHWQYVDIGTGAFFLANVQHKQQFGADLSFEIYSKNKQTIPDVSMMIVKKGVLQQARIGYNAKGLFQAVEWHKFTQSLQKEFRQQQIAEQIKRKEEFSTILSGRTFKLAVVQNGRFKEITAQPGSVIYQISDRFYLIMNSSMDYALLDLENSETELLFNFSKAEYYPSIHLLTLTGKHPEMGLVLHVIKGEKTALHFTNTLVRNNHLYVSSFKETFVFSADGFRNRILLSEKVLFESPGGNYYAVKHQGRGEIYTADKQKITSPEYYFTQFGSVDDKGIILGKANQAISKVLNDPSLVHSMHFYKFKNGQPVLLSKAGCTDAQYLGGGKLACKFNENSWYLYNLSGTRLESQEFSTLDNLLAKLQINKSELIWNKELRPATLNAAIVTTPEKADLLSISTESADIFGVFGPPENRIWVIR